MKPLIVALLLLAVSVCLLALELRRSRARADRLAVENDELRADEFADSVGYEVVVHFENGQPIKGLLERATPATLVLVHAGPLGGPEMGGTALLARDKVVLCQRLADGAEGATS